MRRNVVVLFGVVVAMLLAGSVPSAPAAEYLVNGEVASEGVELVSEGELLFEDMKGGIFGEAVGLLCSVENLDILDTVTLFLITNISPLGKDEFKLKLPCSKQSGICPEAQVEAIDLPWGSRLFSSSGELRAALESTGSGAPGVDVFCSGIEEDTCTIETTTGVQNNVERVILTFDGLSSAGNCTRGGTGEWLVGGSIGVKLRFGSFSAN